MNKWHVGLLNFLDNATRPNSIRVWCGAHHLDIIMADVYQNLLQDNFYYVLVVLIGCDASRIWLLRWRRYARRLPLHVGFLWSRSWPGSRSIWSLFMRTWTRSSCHAGHLQPGGCLWWQSIFLHKKRHWCSCVSRAWRLWCSSKWSSRLTYHRCSAGRWGTKYHCFSLSCKPWHRQQLILMVMSRLQTLQRLF